MEHAGASLRSALRQEQPIGRTRGISNQCQERTFGQYFVVNECDELASLASLSRGIFGVPNRGVRPL